MSDRVGPKKWPKRALEVAEDIPGFPEFRESEPLGHSVAFREWKQSAHCSAPMCTKANFQKAVTPLLKLIFLQKSGSPLIKLFFKKMSPLN
jgi:hypothetical protein